MLGATSPTVGSTVSSRSVSVTATVGAMQAGFRRNCLGRPDPGRVQTSRPTGLPRHPFHHHPSSPYPRSFPRSRSVEKPQGSDWAAESLLFRPQVSRGLEADRVYTSVSSVSTWTPGSEAYPRPRGLASDFDRGQRAAMASAEESLSCSRRCLGSRSSRTGFAIDAARQPYPRRHFRPRSSWAPLSDPNQSPWSSRLAWKDCPRRSSLECRSWASG